MRKKRRLNSGQRTRQYKLRVLKSNIKNNKRGVGRPIPFSIERHTYIIETSVQQDGTLLAFGANCNTEINITSSLSLSSNRQYTDYLNDANNEIKYDRERFEFEN